jgi:hypothetical protein
MIAPPAKTASTRREGDLPPRERILAAARALFYRRGIHVVGVDAIAEAAGTNKMTLFANSRGNSMRPGKRSRPRMPVIPKVSF